MDYNDMTNEALASAHAEKTTAAAALFALTAPTIAQVDEAEALMAQAKALSAQGSTEDLYPVLAQLRHQFRLIAETQQLSPKNIF